MALDQSIVLDDGRCIGYAEDGDLHGQPLLFFHGQPGNRLFRHPSSGLAESAGVRLIAVERPGYGLSTYKPGRRLVDWPQDILALADHLGFERFAILGYSAGGPYAAVCARYIPQRLSRVGLVSSPAPFEQMLRLKDGRPNPLLRLNGFLFRQLPALVQPLFALYWRRSRHNPEAFIRLAARQFCPADRAVLSDPEVAAMLLETWKENVRIDCQGYVDDARLLVSDWGFSCREIAMPVVLWQGDADQNVAPAAAHALARQIPRCTTIIYPGEGHLALLTHWREILTYLVGAG